MIWHADLAATLAVCALAILAGVALRDRFGFLARSNIPAAVTGGLLLAAAVAAMRGYVQIGFDDSLRAPLQYVFFATIGFQVTLRVLRAGGWGVILFWIIAAGTAVVQNAVGITLARALGISPWIGIICGALTLTGGPATGLAFADLFKSLGVPAADEVIVASATFGICLSSLVANPLVSALIRKRGLRGGTVPLGQAVQDPVQHTPWTAARLLRQLTILLLTAGAGAAFATLLVQNGFRVSVSIGPMLAGAVVRWIDDRWGIFELDPPLLEAMGSASLAFFLAVALAGLKIWELAALAGPMLVILGVQTVVTVAYCFATTWLMMGRDYEAAVMTSGHIGFVLGITPNAVANMESLVARFGSAPRAFLIVPVIGAFFVDFANALIITGTVAILR